MQSTDYQDGFTTGQNWNSSWTPGGPWVYRDNSSNPKRQAMARESAQQHADWMQGFNDGIVVRDDGCFESSE